jgi:hypothetical protein
MVRYDPEHGIRSLIGSVHISRRLSRKEHLAIIVSEMYLSTTRMFQKE